MKILYLYSEVMGYTISTISALVNLGAEVHVVHWDHKKLTAYELPTIKDVYFYKRSMHSVKDIRVLVNSIQPDIVVISGWMDKVYLLIANEIRRKGVKVVVCFDDVWFGTLRQKFASILAKFGFFSLFYSHAWVTGPFQFEYARRLGFDKKRIIFDLYSADLNLFNLSYQRAHSKKMTHYPHRFLFVGRFEPIKGIDNLIDVWNLMGEEKKDWELHFIGDGSRKEQIEETLGVVTKGFMQPDDLINEIDNYGCLILPSLREPWGVVVHEFSAAGLPIIVSDSVGSGSSFVISGFNGFKFNSKDKMSLKKSMCQIIQTKDGALCDMARASHLLAQRVTPETSANNLLSILL